jgi:hypothetical protein
MMESKAAKSESEQDKMSEVICDKTHQMMRNAQEMEEEGERERKQGRKVPAPPLPSPYPGSIGTETLDFCDDRKSCELFGGLVRVDFPVTLEQSFAHFKILRELADWNPFTARGQRDKETGEVKPMDMGSCKLPFIVKPCSVDGKELLPLYPFTYLTFNKGPAKRNWSFWRFAELSKQV